jgi:hypothetical protein
MSWDMQGRVPHFRQLEASYFGSEVSLEITAKFQGRQLETSPAREIATE